MSNDELSDYWLAWHIRFLNLAEHISHWSKDPSTKVGCVAVDLDSKRVLAMGYNGFPPRISDTKERLNDREKKYQFVVHAEQNMIYHAALNGVSLDGSAVYVSPLGICNECAKGLITVGVCDVFMPMIRKHVETWHAKHKVAMDMFREANIGVYEIDL